MELAVDSEQGMEELEGDDEMQCSRSSSAAQGKEGGARGRPAARRDSSEISQTLGDRCEDIFIRVPDSPAPPAKRQIEAHALPPSTNRAHAVCSVLACVLPCVPASCRLGTSPAPHRRGVVPPLRAYSRGSDR
jgi:hypothetical protein